MEKLCQVSRVVFNEEPHEYILDKTTKLIGLTQLMAKHKLSADYSYIAKDVLDHAADLGTQAHKAIEAYCDGLPVPETALVKSFKKLGLDIIATEYLVTDFETVASSIDLIAKVDEETVDLIDMKRTSSVHKDSLAWQLGGYKFLFEQLNPKIKVRNCYCLPIKKGNTDDITKDKCGALVEIDPISEWDFRALLDCERLGQMYHKDEPEDNPTEALAETYVHGHFPQLISSLRTIKQMEAYVDKAKEGILAFMDEHNIDSLSLADVTITYKKPYFTTRIDSKKLKAKYPDIAEECSSTSENKGSLTIKLK